MRTGKRWSWQHLVTLLEQRAYFRVRLRTAFPRTRRTADYWAGWWCRLCAESSKAPRPDCELSWSTRPKVHQKRKCQTRSCNLATKFWLVDCVKAFKATLGMMELDVLSSSDKFEPNSGARRWIQSAGSEIEYDSLETSCCKLPTPVSAASVDKPSPFITAYKNYKKNM